MQKVSEKRKAAVIGVFDGVHRGHATLISALVSQARKRNMAPIAVTFDPLPALYFNPHFHFILSTPEEKIGKLHECGVEEVVSLDFSKTREISPAYFIENQLLTRNVGFILVGKTFRFGYKRKGDIETLRNHPGLEVMSMPKE
ncbi:hypothetical protein GF359_00690, partial [candidate division WOR-3 bacterium]|nr:hypothetical protein [candidate division WOR-3 bacterium]MBD3363710.1 hypothetical protein [candidate division WOR-3 bacterium]